MLLLKSTHEALIKSKEAQIAALNSEVAFLRSMVQPSNILSTRNNIEMNAILDGQDSQIQFEVSEEDSNIADEASRVLAGNY